MTCSANNAERFAWQLGQKLRVRQENASTCSARQFGQRSRAKPRVGAVSNMSPGLGGLQGTPGDSESGLGNGLTARIIGSRAPSLFLLNADAGSIPAASTNIGIRQRFTPT